MTPISATTLSTAAAVPADDGAAAAQRRTRCCWLSRAAFALAWIARSRSSSAPSRRFGAPIYVRHEIVHNTYVVNDLRAKGAVFIEDLADVPSGATLVFSAHGVSRAVRDEAQRSAAFRSSTPPARW